MIQIDKTIALVALSAVLWGLYWIPVHGLDSIGISGAWSALFLAICGFISSLALVFKFPLNTVTVLQLLGAVGIGAAFTLYATALAYTDIIRVVLLFYLAPAWSTLIECTVLGRRWTWRSLLGLALSFLGIVVIFRGELPIAGLGALGDWLALAAGLAWSCGSASMFTGKKVNFAVMTIASFFSSAIVAALVLFFIEGPTATDQIDLSVGFLFLVLIGLLIGFLYLLPVTLVTLWGASRIPPAMMSFILTLEVIAAVGSSAILLDQRFGLVELLGTILILSGAMVEMLRVQKTTQVEHVSL